jgi:hypothetical protein
MNKDPYWFQKKWGIFKVPYDDLFEQIQKLEQRVLKLEDENISLTNELYRLENSLDARIDILTLHNWTTQKDEKQD